MAGVAEVEALARDAGWTDEEYVDALIASGLSVADAHGVILRGEGGDLSLPDTWEAHAEYLESVERDGAEAARERAAYLRGVAEERDTAAADAAAAVAQIYSKQELMELPEARLQQLAAALDPEDEQGLLVAEVMQERAIEFGEGADDDLDGSQPAEGEGGDPRELEAEAGPAVGAMPPADPDETQLPPERVVVVGRTKGRTAKAPTRIELALKACVVEVEGGVFTRGEKLSATVEMVVVEEKTTDKLDKDTRAAADSTQRFSAAALDFKLIEE